MKEVLHVMLLLLYSIAVRGQVKEVSKKGNYGVATGGYKENKQAIGIHPQNDRSNNQIYKNGCYTNLVFTVKNYGYNKDGKFYSWGVAVKNNYKKAVQLKYKLIVGNDKTQDGTLTYFVKPGQTYSNDFGLINAIIVNNNSTQYRIEVTEVCFEGKDCSKNGYAGCNGRETGNSKVTIKKSSQENGNSSRSAQYAKEDLAIFTKVDVVAHYSGNWIEFLTQNLNGDVPINNKAPTGRYTVIIQFVVFTDGTIGEIKPITNKGYGMEQEVIRLIKSSGKWMPAMQNGRPVKAYRRQPITFEVKNDATQNIPKTSNNRSGIVSSANNAHNKSSNRSEIFESHTKSTLECTAKQLKSSTKKQL